MHKCARRKFGSSVFGMRFQSRLLRVFRQPHISNQSICEHTKPPTASSLVRQRRLRWFGNRIRMTSCLPVRGVYAFKPNILVWQRPRGRPKTRWAELYQTWLQFCWPHHHRYSWDGLRPTPLEGLRQWTANNRIWAGRTLKASKSRSNVWNQDKACRGTVLIFL